MLLLGKVAIITGGGKGIGRACALAMAEEGAAVAVADIDFPAAEAVVGHLTRAGSASHRAIAIEVDVARGNQVEAMVERTVKTFGRLDVLVNSAGIAYNGDAVNTPEEAWDRLIDVNLKGTWLCCKYAIPHLLANGGGSIINIGSIASFVGLKQNAAYNASKGGVLLLTKNIAADFAPKVRCNAVCPAMILTPMLEAYMATQPSREEYVASVEAATPLGRMGAAEEVAKAAVFLASSQSSYITGSALMVDGGYTAR